jgi:hypothetical protein
LYNNGKYIRQKDVLFGKNISTEVNMEALNVQPCDSLSLHWLTLRTFNAPVGERGDLRKSYTTDSKLECRGYVFFDYGTAAYIPAVQIDDKRTKGASDGYIEFEFDADQKIKISYVGNYSCEITLTANSGLFIVLEHTKDNNEFENALPAPLIKIR